jgi:hypothetical protein
MLIVAATTNHINHKVLKGDPANFNLFSSGLIVTSSILIFIYYVITRPRLDV